MLGRQGWKSQNVFKFGTSFGHFPGDRAAASTAIKKKVKVQVPLHLVLAGRDRDTEKNSLECCRWLSPGRLSGQSVGVWLGGTTTGTEQ